MIKNFKRWLLLTSLPLGALIAFIAYYAVDMVSWDEWAITSLISKFYDGSLTFWDFWAQHNEHRIFLGKIVMLLNAVFAGWNMYIEFAVNILFAICTSIIIYYASQQTDNLNYKKRNLLYFMAACFIFSFIQYGNWLWGFQMQILMCVFFALLTFALLAYAQDKFKYFICAIIAAVFATFSFANGMMTWPAGFLMLLMLDNLNNKYKKLLIWMIIAALSIGAYLYDLKMPAAEGNIYAMLHNPHVFIICFTTYIGSALSGKTLGFALSFGLIGLCAQIYCFIKIFKLKLLAKNKNLLFWFGVSLYILITALITAYGRASINNNLASRYITINLWFWVSLFFQLSIIFDYQDKINAKIYFILMLIIISHLLSEHSFIEANKSYTHLNIFKQQILNGEYDDRHFLQYIAPSRLTALNGIDLLKQHNIRNFENAPEIKFNDFKLNNKINIADLKDSLNNIFVSGWEDLKDHKLFTVRGGFNLENYNYNALGTRVYIELYDYNNNFYEAIIEHGEDLAAGHDDYWASGINHLKSWAKVLRPNNVIQLYNQDYFRGSQLYYGNLPQGDYKTAIRISLADGREFYFKLDKILKVN